MEIKMEMGDGGLEFRGGITKFLGLLFFNRPGVAGAVLQSPSSLID